MNVNHALLAQKTGVLGPFSAANRVHFNLTINGLGGSTGTALGRVVNNATGTNKTLTVGNNNASAIFPGIIADNTSGTGIIAFTKGGNGIQKLTSPNTYARHHDRFCWHADLGSEQRSIKRHGGFSGERHPGCRHFR